MRTCVYRDGHENQRWWYINQRWCEHCLPFHQLSQTMVPIMGYVRGSFTPTCTCCLCIRHLYYTHLVLPKIGSQQGTTQEDPLAMVMYALGTLPLIHAVSTKGAATQTWYADNATAGGRLVQLHMWWDQLQWKGPAFGYFINSSLMQTSSATMFNWPGHKTLPPTNFLLPPPSPLIITAAVTAASVVWTMVCSCLSNYCTIAHLEIICFTFG